MAQAEIKPDTLELVEYGQIVTDLINRAQAQKLQDHFGKAITVSPTWEQGQFQLKASHYVGVIALDDLHIVIRPKVPVQNLFYMLTYAYDLPDFRRESTTLATAADLFDFIITIFTRQVERLTRRGLYRQYVDQRLNQPYLRGRINLNDQLQRNAVHPQRFYQQINQFTADGLENQILYYTLWKLSRFVVKDELRRHIRRAGSAFAEVTLYPVHPQRCLEVIYNRLNRHYRGPVSLAHLLLQHLSLEAQQGETPFPAFLFDMNAVFERFVARFLKEYFDGRYPLLAVEIQPQIWLDTAQSEKAFPDIILRFEGRRVLVLDTKYKQFSGSPAVADRNQMIVYCHNLHLQQGILIYPNTGGAISGNVFKDISLRWEELPLGGDLITFENRCAAFAERLAGIMTYRLEQLSS